MSTAASASSVPELKLLEEITGGINRGRSFGEILDGVYARLREDLPVARMAVGLLDRTGRRMVLAAVRSDAPRLLEVGTQVTVPGTRLERLLRRNEVLNLPDLEAHLARKPLSRLNRLVVEEGMRSSLTVPLVGAGKPVGALFLGSRRPGAFADRHVRLVRHLAAHLALALDRSRLISMLEARNAALAHAKALAERYAEQLEEEVRAKTRALERSQERLQVLLSVSNLVNRAGRLTDAFGQVLEVLRPVVAVDRLALVLVEAEGGQGRLLALAPPGERASTQADAIPLDRSLTGRALRERKTLYWPDLSRAGEVFEAHLAARGFRSYAVVPLSHGTRPVGTLNAASRRACSFSTEDLRFLEQVAEPVSLALQHALAFDEVERLKNRLLQENVTLRAELGGSAGELVGRSRAMERLRAAIRRVGPTDVTVLIRGETGTGKELVARAIHAHSPRRERGFVTVNCAALPEGLAESELFGHEKGAFTGAHERHLGRFELAHRGTLFLDEVGELSPALQGKLLRVLEQRSFERVGGEKTIPVDVRVIAATNRDLEAAVRTGTFRADLYYRLNVFPLEVPPLRERLEDVPDLAAHFMRRFAQRTGRTFRGITPGTLARLMAYPWPGNVRELENVIERAVILCDGPDLRVEPALLAGGLAPAPGLTLEEVERRYILQVLEATGGRIYGPRGAARVLGLKPTTLQSRLKKLGIDRKKVATEGRVRV